MFIIFYKIHAFSSSFNRDKILSKFPGIISGSTKNIFAIKAPVFFLIIGFVWIYNLRASSIIELAISLVQLLTRLHNADDAST